MGKNRLDKQKIEEIRQSIAKQYKERLDDLRKSNKALLIKREEDALLIDELTKANHALEEYCKYLNDLLELHEDDKEFIREELDERKARKKAYGSTKLMLGAMSKYLY